MQHSRTANTYLYFPARDKDHIFRIGVAKGKSPVVPFTPEPNYMQGSFSIDPCVFVDDDGQAYMIFGGLWGGQLEKWKMGESTPMAKSPEAMSPPWVWYRKVIGGYAELRWSCPGSFHSR